MPENWMLQGFSVPIGTIQHIEKFVPKNEITFRPDNVTEVMRVSKDAIWFNPDMATDEVVQGVIKVLEQQWSGRYKQIWNEAIDAAEAHRKCATNIDELKYRLEGMKK